MLAGGFNNAAANVVTLFKVGLIAHTLRIFGEVVHLGALKLASLVVLGRPGGNGVDYTVDTVVFEFCLSLVLPLFARLGAFAEHTFGYQGKMLARVVEVEDLDRERKLAGKHIPDPDSAISQANDLLGGVVSVSMRKRCQ